jgi:hypothetical protein
MITPATSTSGNPLKEGPSLGYVENFWRHTCEGPVITWVARELVAIAHVRLYPITELRSREVTEATLLTLTRLQIHPHSSSSFLTSCRIAAFETRL